MEPRWSDGVWLGFVMRTGESIVGTRHGIEVVRDLKRKAGSEQWSGEQLRAMRGSPWQHRPCAEEGERVGLKSPTENHHEHNVNSMILLICFKNHGFINDC